MLHVSRVDGFVLQRGGRGVGNVPCCELVKVDQVRRRKAESSFVSAARRTSVDAFKYDSSVKEGFGDVFESLSAGLVSHHPVF